MNIKTVDLGLIDYKDAWVKQEESFISVRNGLTKAIVLICRHNPVLTIGRRGKRENILIPIQELKSRGIQLHEAGRGGDVTYHGPGQITVYPVFNLNFFKKDIHWFLRYLEEFIIDYLEDLAVKGHRRPGLTGVWVKERKIASIGIGIKNWISFHGFSINIKNNDLTNFSLIKPCGMDIMLTSAESECAKVIDMELAVALLKNKWAEK